MLFNLNKMVNQKFRQKELQSFNLTLHTFLIPSVSFFVHLANSSSILVIFVGFKSHKNPFTAFWLVAIPTEFPFSAELDFGLGSGIFWKHLFMERACRTEFFHPCGAVLKNGKCSQRNL